jgi:hypothetical protein
LSDGEEDVPNGTYYSGHDHRQIVKENMNLEARDAGVDSTVYQSTTFLAYRLASTGDSVCVYSFSVLTPWKSWSASVKKRSYATLIYVRLTTFLGSPRAVTVRYTPSTMTTPLFFTTFEVTRQVFHRTPLAYAIVNLKPIVPGRT